MKATERDALLIRLDERSESVIRELQDQNKHLAQINGSQRKLATKVNILWGVAIALIGGTGFSLSRLIG